MGDALWVEPVASAVKQCNQNCEVIVETDYTDFFENHPTVSAISAGGLSECGIKPDIILDLSSAYEKSSNVLFGYKAYFDVAYDQKLITEDHVKNIKLPQLYILESQHSDFLFPKDYICMHSYFSSWPGRTINNDVFIKIQNNLNKHGIDMITIGNGVHAPSCKYNLIGQTSIRFLYEIIKKSNIFFGPDSGPFHIAQSLHKKSCVYFGCVDPKSRIYADNVTVIQNKSLNCLGCYHEHKKYYADGTTYLDFCASGKNSECMNLSADTITDMLIDNFNAKNI